MAEINRRREHMRAVYQVFQKFSLEDQRRYWQATTRKYRTAVGQVNFIVALFSFLTGFSAALAGLLVSAYLVDGSFANSGACANLAGSRTLVTTLRNIGVIDESQAAQSLEALAVEGTGSGIDNETVQAALAALSNSDAANCGFISGFVNFLMIMAVVTPAIGGAFTTLASLYQWDRTVSIYDGALENLEVADSQSPMDDMDDLTYKAALRAYVENTLRVMAEETAQWGQSVRTPPELEKFVEEERRKAARASRSRGTGPITTVSDAIVAEEESNKPDDSTT
jgi:hypothetical protein